MLLLSLFCFVVFVVVAGGSGGVLAFVVVFVAVSSYKFAIFSLLHICHFLFSHSD